MPAHEVSSASASLRLETAYGKTSAKRARDKPTAEVPIRRPDATSRIFRLCSSAAESKFMPVTVRPTKPLTAVNPARCRYGMRMLRACQQFFLLCHTKRGQLVSAAGVGLLLC